MFFRHHTDKLIYPIIVLVLLVLICYRPKYRLRADMPARFFSSVNKNDPAQKIAAGYWKSALSDIQWKYPHGNALPVDPPLEFRVNDKTVAPLAVDASVRALYWRRLQQVWISPEAWTQDYEWDWSWASDPFSSASEWLRDHVSDWMSSHSPR